MNLNVSLIMDHLLNPEKETAVEMFSRSIELNGLKLIHYLLATVIPHHSE